MKRLFFILYLLSTFVMGGLAKDSADDLFNAAKAADAAGNLEQAYALFLRADSAFVAEGREKSVEYAHALHNTGRACFNLNMPNTGRDYTLKAMQLKEDLFGRESQEYVVSLNNYALSFLMANDPGTALTHAKEVVRLAQSLNPPSPDEGMYLINLARAYHEQNDGTNAIRYMEEALGKVEKFGTYYEYALQFLGMCYSEAEDNANMKRILALMEEHNQHELQKECTTPDCRLERAQYFAVKGETDRAKEEYLAVFSMGLTPAQEVKACDEYARFLFDLRDFATAAEYKSRAAVKAKQSFGENEAYTRLNLQAATYHLLARAYDKAVALYQSVIADVDKYEYDEKMKAFSLQHIGQAYRGKKDFEKAAAVCEQWLALLQKNGGKDDSETAQAYEELAVSEKFAGRYDQSIAHYKTAIALYERLNLQEKKAAAKAGLKMCLVYAGKETDDVKEDVSEQQQREDKLREIIRTSKNVIEQGGEILGKLALAQTLGTIAGSYAMLEDYEQSVAYYEQYIAALRPALTQDFLMKNPKERAVTWQGELFNLGQMNDLIVKLLLEEKELYDRHSTSIYEGQLLAKGILLTSNVEFDKVLERRGTKEMKRAYEEIRQSVEQLEMMKNSDCSVEDFLKLSEKTEAMQLKLAREASALAGYTDFLKVTMRDVADALKEDELAVEFVTLNDALFSDEHTIVAVVAQKNKAKAFAIPVCYVGDVKRMAADPQGFTNEKYGASVWERIINSYPDKKRIYFAPDGVMNRLAVEYLKYNGRPLSEQVEMVRLSSTKEICQKRLSAPLSRVALFGDVDYLEEGIPAYTEGGRPERGKQGLNFSNLDETAREVAEIGSLFKQYQKKAKVDTFTGAEAGKSSFLRQDGNEVNLLHIATHGDYVEAGRQTDADAMKCSVLAFAGANLYDGYEANTGIVNAAEIAKMSLHHCDLVVLSACKSGLGRLGEDGVFGLQRGFKNAGVRSLLVSLNNVSDSSTADMMIAFYRHLLAAPGTSKREALQKAQAEIRARYPDDPTWASFILIDSLD